MDTDDFGTKTYPSPVSLLTAEPANQEAAPFHIIGTVVEFLNLRMRRFTRLAPFVIWQRVASIPATVSL